MPDSFLAATVAVHVVYLARLRETLGATEETVTVKVDGRDATVEDVVAALVSRGGAWASELATGRAVRVAVNHAMTKRSAAIRSGDEVAFFPPVTGG